MSIKASALLSPPSRPAWTVSATLACFGTSGSLAVFTHRVLENRQNILQFISLPFIILNLFRDAISSCSCFTCGFRAFLSALFRFCQVFSLLLENLWSVFNLVLETVPFLSLSDFGHPTCGALHLHSTAFRQRSSGHVGTAENISHLVLRHSEVQALLPPCTLCVRKPHP